MFQSQYKMGCIQEKCTQVNAVIHYIAWLTVM